MGFFDILTSPVQTIEKAFSATGQLAEDTLYSAVTGNASQTTKQGITSSGIAMESQAAGIGSDTYTPVESLQDVITGQTAVVNQALTNAGANPPAPGSPCSSLSSVLSDPLGCVSIPSWLKWVSVGLVILVILFALGVLEPYVKLLKGD